MHVIMGPSDAVLGFTAVNTIQSRLWAIVSIARVGIRTLDTAGKKALPHLLSWPGVLFSGVCMSSIS